jgi:hypothetical protein
MPDTRFITDREIYEEVILGAVPSAREFLWLATSDLKDLHVDRGRRMVPFLQGLPGWSSPACGSLLHAKEPGPLFRRDFDRFPYDRRDGAHPVVPACYFKCVVVDGRLVLAKDMSEKKASGRPLEASISAHRGRSDYPCHSLAISG